MRNWMWAAAAATWAAAASLAAAADVNPAAAFGARQVVRQASLSPDGQSVALVQSLPDGPGNGLFIAKVDGSTGIKPIVGSSGKGDLLDSCGWVSNTRLICEVSFVSQSQGMRIFRSRLVAVAADGSKLEVLSARATGDEYSLGQNGGDIVDWLAGEASGAVLMTRDFAPEYSTGTMLNSKRDGLGVERVDTETLKRTLIETPKTFGVNFISDQYGSVRIFGQLPSDSEGYSRTKYLFSYRPTGKTAWTPFSTFDRESHVGFLPVSVDRALDVAYGYEWIDGRQSVVRMSLDGSMKREVVMTRDDVDVDGLVRIGRQHRVVGVTFATDKREAVFFDPALKTLAASLSKALPGQPMVRFVDASSDESRLLVWVGNDVQPGRYYLYDKPTRRLSPLVEERPPLSAVKLSPVQAISYRAADGTMIPAYLTLPPGSDGKNLPAIVMPHGGPGARDEWGFDWLSQYFASRGYAVLQPNFRGSSGYGDAWFQKNGFQSWRTALGDVTDAGRWLNGQGIAAPGKLAIVGWSYGGYAALQANILDADLFKAVVAIAPVTDLAGLREDARDYTNFTFVDHFIGNGPHVREGSPAQNAERIKAPVLMFHGDLDENVKISQSRLMQTKLKGAGKSADLIVYPGLDHQLDDTRARTDMLARADAFLRTSLGF